MERGREGKKTTARFSYSILVVTARIKNQRAKAHNPRDRAERVPLVQRNTPEKTAPAELPGVPRTSLCKNAGFTLKNWPKQVGGPVHPGAPKPARGQNRRPPGETKTTASGTKTLQVLAFLSLRLDSNDGCDGCRWCGVTVHCIGVANERVSRCHRQRDRRVCGGTTARTAAITTAPDALATFLNHIARVIVALRVRDPDSSSRLDGTPSYRCLRTCRPRRYGWVIVSTAWPSLEPIMART
jgi:hypothetical protein